MELSTKIFLIIIACAVTGSLIGVASADDYFPIVAVWDHKPYVCLTTTIKLHEPFKALDDWEEQLRIYTSSTNFDYTLYRGVKKECDIIIHENQNATNVNGITNCTVKFQTFANCVINIMTTTSPNYRGDTYKHELGHALGLGHRQTDNKESFPYLIMQDDIMFRQASPFDKITEADLDALLFIYNNDGWNLPNNYNETYSPQH